MSTPYELELKALLEVIRDKPSNATLILQKLTNGELECLRSWVHTLEVLAEQEARERRKQASSEFSF